MTVTEVIWSRWRDREPRSHAVSGVQGQDIHTTICSWQALPLNEVIQGAGSKETLCNSPLHGSLIVQMKYLGNVHDVEAWDKYYLFRTTYWSTQGILELPPTPHTSHYMSRLYNLWHSSPARPAFGTLSSSTFKTSKYPHLSSFILFLFQNSFKSPLKHANIAREQRCILFFVIIYPVF